jgi:hypothetical protein
LKIGRCTIFILIALIALSAIGSCSKGEKQEEEWITLFNGKDLNDWIPKINHYNAGENFGNTFRIKDNMIEVNYDQYGSFNDRFGHLFYNVPFGNFQLSLEYQFTGSFQEGGPEYARLNSGVMYHSQSPSTILKDQNWPISVEMQFLASLGDGESRPTGNMCSPGTDIQYQGKLYPGHCLTSSSPTFQPNEWIRAELIVWNDSSITHLVNGDTVLQYAKPTIGGGVVDGYDSALWKPGMALKAGYIGLQSEGQPILFRNIKLRKLK